MSSPAVSVVMPAFNAASYISESIRSVLAQSFGDLELLVVDDCSDDGTASVVHAVVATDSRVRYVALPVNAGAPAKPRNIGVSLARASWVAFIDADDIWHPEKLARQMQVIGHTGVSFCSSRMVNFTASSSPAFPSELDPNYEWITFFNQLVKFRTPMSSVVASKALLQRFTFNESLEYKAREDLDCWLRIHEEIGRSAKLKAILVGYRIDPGQISSKKWLMVKRHFKVLRRYQFGSGRRLGLAAVFFTFTHFVMSPYYRLIRKGL